ncbi:MAG: hypothetical protein KIT72_07365 [Polyangiaceae bacterium]|nr:hypothetical protein [Polyangiaceae bacterium]MCW5790222.1 hypothetical protein [Polyangiaceae bacterium]
MAPSGEPRWWQRRHLERLGLLSLALLFGYVAFYPQSLVRYPPVTDMPFHAANTSILRHYFDDAFGFREQFQIDPLRAPYMTHYLLGAALSLVLPIHVAVKLASVLMLCLLPAGLALLLRGLGKRRVGALLALGLFYSTLTHWGFISHVAALGCFLGSLGATLLTLQASEPKAIRRRAVLLAVLLTFTLLTHVYRYPFAAGGALLLLVFSWKSSATRRAQLATALALLPSAVLFLGFWFTRDHGLGDDLTLTFEPSRLQEVPLHLFGGFKGTAGAHEQQLGLTFTLLALGLGVGSAFIRHARRSRSEPATRSTGTTRHEHPAETERDCDSPLPSKAVPSNPPLVHPPETEGQRDVGAPQPPNTSTTLTHPERPDALKRRAHYALALMCGVIGLLYVCLPLTWGSWFFVYPREALTLAALGLALLPGLPRLPLVPLVLALCLSLSAGRQAYQVAVEWRRFEALNQDFYAMQQHLPPQPKLLYLIYDHTGTQRSTTPFIHLPAWVQAERGGALYFHFVRWGLYPIRYREGSPHDPPRLPYFLEWRPDRFQVLEHGAWFDTFLVRHTIDPSVVFAADPSIRLVAREGTWWLFRREP